MSAKLIFVLATAFLLVQYSCGKAVPNFEDIQPIAEQVVEENTKDSLSVTEPKKLPEKLNHILQIEGVRFFKAIFRLNKKLAEKLLSKLSVDDVDEQDLLAESTKKYLKGIDDVLSLEDEELLAADDEDISFFVNATQIFFSDALPLYLEENFIETLQEVVVATVKFSQELKSDVETYWDSLSAQEKEEQADFGHWLQKFSEEVNPVKKLLLFFDAYEDVAPPEDESEEDEVLAEFIYEQLNKLSAIAFEILAENLSYLAEDLSAVEEKDEELAENIETVSAYISELKAVKPDFIERITFLKSSKEFLQSAIDVLLESAKNHIPNPREYIIAKLSPFIQEFIDEASKLDLPDKSPLQVLIKFFKLVKDEPDTANKIKMLVTSFNNLRQ